MNLLEDEDVDVDSDSMYVEAIVVIANGGTLLKAEANPYMMGDRPVVAFLGILFRGGSGVVVCAKKATTARRHWIQNYAHVLMHCLTIHPMMAIDATRLPRGAKPEVRPGKMILTNGDPREVLQPFNFGQVNQITFAQAQRFNKWYSKLQEQLTPLVLLDRLMEKQQQLV